ncbi:MAG: hypothetical protein ACI9MC_003177 [Kiritimatiellia bacterium]|jgi:hypothetical protein
MPSPPEPADDQEHTIWEPVALSDDQDQTMWHQDPAITLRPPIVRDDPNEQTMWEPTPLPAPVPPTSIATVPAAQTSPSPWPVALVIAGALAALSSIMLTLTVIGFSIWLSFT